MENQLEDLKAIREMMEKSSKFLSLSGKSGIGAGTTALIGATVAYFYILRQPRTIAEPMLIIDAIIVLGIALSLGFYFSYRKSLKRNEKFVSKVLIRIIYNLLLPLLVGGLISIIMITRNQIDEVAGITLIFYGLALINTSKYTYDEIHFLGITEVVLGLLAMIFIKYGIIFWALGFGVCHIIYGIIMYLKYDNKSK
jgi:hypothetical protein